MTMGLILLAVIALLIFFGLTDRMTRSIRLANWLTFVLILLLAAGAIAPDIPINDMLSINVGAFILPVLLMLILGLMVMRKGGMLRAVLAEFAVGTVASMLLFFFPADAVWQRILCAVVIGLSAGILAYLIAPGYESVLFATLGGVAMGELSMRLTAYLIWGTPITLGSGTAFDAMILAAFTGIVFLEIFASIRHAAGERSALRGNLSFEAGRDAGVTAKKEKKTEDFSDYFEDEM